MRLKELASPLWENAYLLSDNNLSSMLFLIYFLNKLRILMF